MLISMIILGVLGLMIILGLGKYILKDFGVNWIVGLVFLAMVIGLNFIPVIDAGGFVFSIGTLLFYAVVIVNFFIYGKFSNNIIHFMLALIFGGLIYASTRISLLTGNAYFGTTNWVHALAVGIIAFAISRNGKYAFLIGAEAMMLANILVQIGSGVIDLNYNFDWTVVAAGTAFTFYAITSMFIPNRKVLAIKCEMSKPDDEK